MSSFSAYFSSRPQSSKITRPDYQGQHRKNFLIGGGIVIIGLFGIMTTLWLTKEPQDIRQQASELVRTNRTNKIRSVAKSKGLNVNNEEVNRIDSEVEKINNSKKSPKLAKSKTSNTSTQPENSTWEAGVTSIAVEKLRNPSYSPLTDFNLGPIDPSVIEKTSKARTAPSKKKTSKLSFALGGTNLGSQIAETAILPASYDWRNVHGGNFLTDVKNQGACGSCWAFSGNAATELAISAYYNQPTKKIDLSEQNLLSCSSNTTGCIGTKSLIHDYYDYIVTQGAVTESCMAYQSCDQTTASCTCPAGAKCAGTPAIYKSNFSTVPVVWTKLDSVDQIVDTYATAQNIKRAIIEHGAVNTGIYIYNDFLYYVSGVYERSSTSTYAGGHAISIIGWGEENGQAYWLIKNSWSPSWGIQGYGKYKMLGSTPGSTLDLDIVYNSYKNTGGLDFGIEGLAGLFLIVQNPNPVLVYSDVPTAQNDTLTRACTDRDADSYCFWGLGSAKPATGCPASCATNSFPDCDDGNNTLGANCTTISILSPSPTLPVATATPVPIVTIFVPTPTASIAVTAVPTPTASIAVTAVPTPTVNPSCVIGAGNCINKTGQCYSFSNSCQRLDSCATPYINCIPLQADINLDGKVDQADLTILLTDYGKPVHINPRSDINLDGKVNAIDYVYLLDYFGQTSIQ